MLELGVLYLKCWIMTVNKRHDKTITEKNKSILRDESFNFIIDFFVFDWGKRLYHRF